MLSKDLENTLNLLFKECSDNNDEFVTIEHLLLGFNTRRFIEKST